MQCPKCKKLMDKHPHNKKICECGSQKFKEEFDLSSIIALDTILISSRHLYRMPYSLHEKTGLVSMPFDIKHILKFEKSEAEPLKFKPYKFLDRKNAKIGEAELLFQKAFDYKSEKISKYKESVKKEFMSNSKNTINSENIDAIQVAVPEECFPPCIKKILIGLEDGKKRALFILIQFLSAANWDYEKIEEYILKWNERNKPEGLRETYIRGQLRYYKTQNKNNSQKIAPPSCDNRGYMIDTQFCAPDGLCKTIKNPIQYAKKRAWLMNNSNTGRKKSEKKHTEKINTPESEKNILDKENKNFEK